MRHYQGWIVGVLLLALGGLTTWAEEPAQPATKAVSAKTSKTPSVSALPVDFSSPDKTFETYLKAMQGFHFATLKECVVVTLPEKARLVESHLTFLLWQNYLEREAIRKFGAEEGLTVLSHSRSYEQQIAIDLKRLPLSNVDVDPGDKTIAILYLKPERNPPVDLKPDEVFHFKKVGSAWKLDYIKTRRLDDPDPDRQEALKLNESLYPKMALAMKTLTEQVKRGDFKTAADVKLALDKAWETAIPAPKEE